MDFAGSSRKNLSTVLFIRPILSIMSMRIELGRAKFADKNSGARPAVFWDPATAISGHAIIVGSSGVGKTYRLRRILHNLISTNGNVNIHILDVHGDIAPHARNKVDFSEITNNGLNPLEVITDPEFGGVRRRINSFIDMINRTSTKLGVRQEATLRALLEDLYHWNGYDAKDPRTWDPRTNPKVRGFSQKTRKHPTITNLVNICAWKLNVLITGGGADAYKALAEVNKHARKMNAEALKKDGCSDEKMDSLILKANESYENYTHKIRSGREMEEFIKYGSPDVLKAVFERIKGLDAVGIFKDEPPVFPYPDPPRVYNIKALAESEQRMFAEVLLERLFVEAKARGQKDTPDTFIVIDEAHKFLSPQNDHIINRMSREIRKFGVGLILVSQNFDHFPQDIIANSAMTLILGLHDMDHGKAERSLGLKPGKLKFIKPKQTALVQVRSGLNNGLTNTFNDILLAS